MPSTPGKGPLHHPTASQYDEAFGSRWRWLVNRPIGVQRRPLHHVNRPAQQDAAQHGIHLEVVKLPEAKHGFVLLPRRSVIERSFAWMARFRRLAREYERLPETLLGLHYLAFAILMLTRFVTLVLQANAASP